MDINRVSADDTNQSEVSWNRDAHHNSVRTNPVQSPYRSNRRQYKARWTRGVAVDDAGAGRRDRASCAEEDDGRADAEYDSDEYAI